MSLCKGLKQLFARLLKGYISIVKRNTTTFRRFMPTSNELLQPHKLLALRQ